MGSIGRIGTGDGEPPASAARALLQRMVREVFAGRIALVSSFGIDSAVLLHLVADTDPAIPVIFIDTGRLFPETLAYRDALCADLGLVDVRTASPAPSIAQLDPDGVLWQEAPDACCWHRKVEPLDAAVQGFAAWITGRRRVQGGERGALPLFEEQESGVVKLNPLVSWTETDLAQYRDRHGLRPHPLAAAGYGSVGCVPCTRPNLPGEAARAGRWSGTGKTECGIHLPRPAPIGGVA